MSPRVLVVGAGGLGTVTAACLLEAGAEVTSLVRPGATAAALGARGFVVREGTLEREVAANVVTTLDEVGPQDVVVLATQPTDVQEAARQVLPVLTADSQVVVLQNGLCEAKVAAIVGADRVVGAVVAWGADVEAPGVVRRTSRGRFTLGRLDGQRDDGLQRVGALLSAVAPVTTTTNLLGARWTKLAFNCAISTLGTLGGDRVGPLIAHAFVRRLALEIMTEAVAVARAEGVELEPLAGFVSLDRLALSAEERTARWSLSRMVKHALVLAVGYRIRHLRSSMLRALEAGRPPAVDFLNGDVSRLGAQHGVPTPFNDAAAALVHRVAAGEVRVGLGTLRLLLDPPGR